MVRQDDSARKAHPTFVTVTAQLPREQRRGQERMRALDTAAFLTVTDLYCPGDVAEQLRLHCTSGEEE